jgi:hypothetical protein
MLLSNHGLLAAPMLSPSTGPGLSIPFLPSLPAGFLVAAADAGRLPPLAPPLGPFAPFPPAAAAAAALAEMSSSTVGRGGLRMTLLPPAS